MKLHYGRYDKKWDYRQLENILHIQLYVEIMLHKKYSTKYQ